MATCLLLDQCLTRGKRVKRKRVKGKRKRGMN
jgi:hypothetical protein